MPGPDWRVEPARVTEEGWESLFAPDLTPPLRLVVELGFGRGEYLMHLAESDSGVAHVGVEVSRKRVLKMARRIARTPLRNVRLIHDTGEQVVRELLRPVSVEAVWINFSDPWPKKRHHRRRLVQPALVADIAERLVPGGALYVATDDRPYAEHIDATLAAEARLENVYAPRPWLPEVPGRKSTAYELEWRAEGRPLHFWAYRRRAGGSG